MLEDEISNTRKVTRSQALKDAFSKTCEETPQAGSLNEYVEELLKASKKTSSTEARRSFEEPASSSSISCSVFREAYIQACRNGKHTVVGAQSQLESNLQDIEGSFVIPGGPNESAENYRK